MLGKTFRSVCLAIFALGVFSIPAVSHRVEPDPGLTGASGRVTYDSWIGDGEWWERYMMYDSTQDSNNNTASSAHVHLTKHATVGIPSRVKGSSYGYAWSAATVSGAVAKGNYHLLATATVYWTSKQEKKDEFQGQWSDNVSKSRTYWGNTIFSNVHVHGKALIKNQAGTSHAQGTWN